MIIKRFTLVLLALFIMGCYGIKNPKKPKNLISKDEMVNILIDIRLMTSATGTNKRTLDETIPDKEAFIYNKYNIDSLQFALSNEYYAYRIDDYDDIYTRVKDSLEALKTKYKDLEDEELQIKKVQDSIRDLMEKDRLTLHKKIDSIKARLTDQDTLALNKKIDSLRGVFKVKDSLRRLLFDGEFKEERLIIPPVSDTDDLND